MNVLAFRFWNFSYSDGMSVMSKLNDDFGFDSVVCMEKPEDMEKVRKSWNGGNLTLIDYYNEVQRCKLEGMQVRDMPPLSRELIEKVSLDRCRLYHLHRDETLLFRELDEEVMNYLTYCNYLLDKFKVDLFLCNGAPHALHTYAFYALCKARGIKYIYVARSCVPGYSFCHDDVFEPFARLKKVYNDAMGQNGPIPLSDYIKNSYAAKMEKDQYRVPDSYKMSTRVKVDTQRRTSKWKQFKAFLHRIYNRQFGITGDYFYNKKAIAKKTHKYYCKISGSADYSKRYIYVPLQMQPELSTSPLGNVYVNLLLMVQTVAYCVKGTDIRLYVKEHGSQTEAYRLSRRELYDGLRALPNVHIINKEEDSFKLQDNAIASVTCSGMVIMESLFKYKPVLVFGSHINNLAPNAYVVSDVKSCAAAIDDIQSGNFSIGRKERDAFLYALEQTNIHGFVRSEHAAEFGLSQDESAENTYLEVKARLGEMLSVVSERGLIPPPEEGG